jgi:hypothetical protein
MQRSTGMSAVKSAFSSNGNAQPQRMPKYFRNGYLEKFYFAKERQSFRAARVMERPTKHFGGNEAFPACGRIGPDRAKA